MRDVSTNERRTTTLFLADDDECVRRTLEHFFAQCPGYQVGGTASDGAAAVGGCLKAESLLSHTDTAGLLKDPSDPATLMSKVYVSDIGNLVRAGIITGGMTPKIECCAESIRRGVHRVFIVDGRVPHSILIELLTDEGIGTMFVAVDEEV